MPRGKQNKTKTKTKNCKARITKRRTKEEYIEGKEYPIDVWRPPKEVLEQEEEIEYPIEVWEPPEKAPEQSFKNRVKELGQQIIPSINTFGKRVKEMGQQLVPRLDSFVPPQMYYETNAERRMMPNDQQWNEFDQQRCNSVNQPKKDTFSMPGAGESFNKGSNYYKSIKNKIPRRERRIEKQETQDERTTKIVYNGDIIEVPVSMIPRKRSWIEKNGKKIVNAAIAATTLAPAAYACYKVLNKGMKVKNLIQRIINHKPSDENKEEKKS